MGLQGKGGRRRQASRQENARTREGGGVMGRGGGLFCSLFLRPRFGKLHSESGKGRRGPLRAPRPCAMKIVPGGERGRFMPSVAPPTFACALDPPAPNRKKEKKEWGPPPPPSSYAP